MDRDSKLKSLVKRLYRLPGIGYLVRLAVSFGRLPVAEAYHAHLLKALHDGLAANEAERAEHATLLAELAALLEKLRQQQALAKSEADGRIDEIRATFDHWLPELLNRTTIHDVALQRLEEPSSDRDEEPKILSQNLPNLTSRLEELEQNQQQIASELGDRIDHVSQHCRQAIDSFHVSLSERFGAVEAELTKRGLELGRATDYWANRIEFVRRETLFEVRYGKAPTPNERPETNARIIRPEKLSDVPRGGHRLNVGCGHIPLEGYINVDRRDLPSVDVVAEAGDMPFDQGSVAEILSTHLLEHFPQEQLRREILPYWRTLLKAGGVLRAVVPDTEAMMRGYREGKVTYDDFREVTFGAQDYDGDFHFNMFTPDSLIQLLEEAGFVDVGCPVRERRNGRCFEFEVVATAPGDLQGDLRASVHRATSDFSRETD